MELVCHFDANDNPDPIILDYWCAGHYAGGASCSIPAGEEWNKVIGPIFVYCNAWPTQRPSPAELATLAATAGNPPCPPSEGQRHCPLAGCPRPGQKRKSPMAL